MLCRKGDLNMDLIKMEGFFHPTMVRGRIHIIGCGAVGSTIAVMLAHAGLTDFVLYDDDTVESHNIANQMFREKDVGKKKVDALAEILTEINGEIGEKIKTVPERYTDQPLSGCVFLCVDSIATRKAIAKQHKLNPSIAVMSDVRISLTDAQHYLADWHDSLSVRNFIGTMNFTDEQAAAETPHTACNTALSVCTTVYLICSLAVSNFMNFVKSEGKTFRRTIQTDAFLPSLDAF